MLSVLDAYPNLHCASASQLDELDQGKAGLAQLP